ncbi:MAG: TetR/AcrR family transcriptional regulator [Lachnospiraceae bacterium]|jgi:AcrR family transcriptional regulator|nr:TetR/AcrR family transcriptional regulator [Lachnospiraceae bacterium]MCX4375982.1 TetR/AcrR family transcriptional regulator [Lachnospiraceae bacterium]
MTRIEQKEAKKMKIIQAALDLFVERGYYGTKTSQISRRAGISEGLLFHYFPTKEILLEELVNIGLEGMRMPMLVKAENGLDFFYQFTKMLFLEVEKNPYIAKMFVFMGHVVQAEDIPEKIRQLAASVDTIVFCQSWVEAGQKDGSIREGNAKSLSNMYWCAIHGIMEQYAFRPEMLLPESEWITGMMRNEKKSF